MKFSWQGLLLAPLPIPVILSILLELSTPGRNPLLAVLFFSIAGSIISYSTTIFLLLPCLFIVSRFTQLTARLTGLTGTFLGFLVYIPVIWTSYNASGVDSGPPQGTFMEYLRHHGFEWDFWVFVSSGLITSTLYWLIVNKTSRAIKPQWP